jgi:hypothetical protein
MRWWNALVLVSLLAASGCDKKPPPPPKPISAGSVRIVALTPETTTALKVGAKVKIELEVSYRLLADAGAVTLVVQANDKALAQMTRAVRQGEGTAKLSAEFVVPDTNAIQIFTPLQALGQKTTATLDRRTYKVAPQ